MKLQILTFGVDATHDQLLHLNSLFGATSISDFDAFVFDMSRVQKAFIEIGTPTHALSSWASDESGALRHSLKRHAKEITDLLSAKGGVVIVLLSVNTFEFNPTFWSNGRRVADTFGPDFFILDALKQSGCLSLQNLILAGTGDRITIANQSVPSYLRILKDSLYFQATFDATAQVYFNKIFATDSVGRIVAGEVKVGSGSIIFLPYSRNDDPKRRGAAIVQTVRERLSNESPDITPEWVEKILVPGSDSNNERLNALVATRMGIDAEISDIEMSREDLLAHRRLLFTTGKHVLEPAVRNAFRVLGFSVEDPDSYEGEWDLEMLGADGSLFIGEVEGPEGAVDLDKFRQALDYHNDRLLAGQENKGLLVGNAHRLLELEKRGNAFTEHAVRAAERTDIALVPTLDLFRAVCDALTRPAAKSEIQVSLKTCTGVWQWPQEKLAP